MLSQISKQKKELKEAVKNGKKVVVFSPGPFPAKKDGVEAIEGPHYTEPHKWYARVLVKNGEVVRIVS